MKKKIISIITILILCFGLLACQEGKEPSTGDKNEPTTGDENIGDSDKEDNKDGESEKPVEGESKEELQKIVSKEEALVTIDQLVVSDVSKKPDDGGEDIELYAKIENKSKYPIILATLYYKVGDETHGMGIMNNRTIILPGEVSNTDLSFLKDKNLDISLDTLTIAQYKILANNKVYNYLYTPSNNHYFQIIEDVVDVKDILVTADKISQIDTKLCKDDNEKSVISFKVKNNSDYKMKDIVYTYKINGENADVIIMDEIEPGKTSDLKRSRAVELENLEDTKVYAIEYTYVDGTEEKTVIYNVENDLYTMEYDKE